MVSSRSHSTRSRSLLSEPRCRYRSPRTVSSTVPCSSSTSRSASTSAASASSPACSSSGRCGWDRRHVADGHPTATAGRRAAASATWGGPRPTGNRHPAAPGARRRQLLRADRAGQRDLGQHRAVGPFGGVRGGQAGESRTEPNTTPCRSVPGPRRPPRGAGAPPAESAMSSRRRLDPHRPRRAGPRWPTARVAPHGGSPPRM